MAAQEGGSLAGSTLASRYLLIRLIKAGGMGAVYEAEDTKLGRRIAVKVLSSELTEQPDMLRRFFREAKAPSFAQHPNIVEYLDFDQIEDSVAYLVMEYLQGDDLERVLKSRGPLSWTELAPLMLQSSRALGAAHAAGIIHRDIKPSNLVLLDRAFDGDPPLIKLIDFGIAKFTEESRFHSDTEVTQHLMGSQRFIAPEMYVSVPANPRTDIYALGVTMFRLLTGKYPESNGYDMLPPSALCPDKVIPPEVDALILRAIHVNPYARFATMGDLDIAIASSFPCRPTPSDSITDSSVRPARPQTGVRKRELASATFVHRRSRAKFVVIAVFSTVLVAVLAKFLADPSDDGGRHVPHPETEPAVTRNAPLDRIPALIPLPTVQPRVTLDSPAGATHLEPAGTKSVAPEDAPVLDMGLVDKQLRRQAVAVRKCALMGGLFKGMMLNVTVRIEPNGKTRSSIGNAGGHGYVICIQSKLERLNFGPSKAGGVRAHKYKI